MEPRDPDVASTRRSPTRIASIGDGGSLHLPPKQNGGGDSEIANSVL